MLRKENGDKVFLKNTEITLFLADLFLFVILSFITDSFFTVYNLSNILKQASIIGVVSIAATIVIMSGGIDLSVGSIVGWGSLLSAIFMVTFKMPIPLVIILSLLGTGVIGLLNGVLIYDFRLPPFIATLGTMIVIRGVIEVVGKAKTIVGIYPKFIAFSTDKFLSIPKLAWVWILTVVLVALIIKYTRFGRNILVIGNGQEVAKLSGINLRSNTYSIYAVAGILSGIAGLLLTSRISSATPMGGAGYEMTSIAAAVIGGASLMGGEGSITGTLLGTFLMVIIDNGGIQLGINPFVMDITSGVLIIIAVAIDHFRKR